MTGYMTVTKFNASDGTVMLHASPDELGRVSRVLSSAEACSAQVKPETKTRMDGVRNVLTTMLPRNPRIVIGWIPAKAAADIAMLGTLVPIYASMDMRPEDWDLLFGTTRA